jgi:hypothetical protein
MTTNWLSNLTSHSQTTWLNTNWLPNDYNLIDYKCWLLTTTWLNYYQWLQLQMLIVDPQVYKLIVDYKHKLTTNDCQWLQLQMLIVDYNLIWTPNWLQMATTWLTTAWLNTNDHELTTTWLHTNDYNWLLATSWTADYRRWLYRLTTNW